MAKEARTLPKAKSISSRAPRKAFSDDFFAPTPKKWPSCIPRSRTQAESGAPRDAGASCFGAKQPRACRVSETGASSPSSPWFLRESMPRLLPPVSLAIDSSWGGAATPLLPCMHTHGRDYIKPVASVASGHTSPSRRALLHPCAAAEPSLSHVPPSSPSSTTTAPAMAERFLGDEAAANGFGRCSLREQELWLLFEANIPVPPSVRHGDAGQGCTRDGRVKEEKDDDDDGDDSDYSAFSKLFFRYICYI
ncbi:hypothetical protein VPH35_105460 [Triticum aestivum]